MDTHNNKRAADGSKLRVSAEPNTESMANKFEVATTSRDELKHQTGKIDGLEPKKRKKKKKKKTEDMDDSQRPSKRPRCKGFLKEMLDMPLDILFEIFSQMHPRDLLSLSRTTKAFIQLLTSKSSVHFWKASFENISESLPPRLPNISELQLANLLFSNHCHNCSKGNIQSIMWEIRARLCNKCKEEVLLKCSDVRDGWWHLRTIEKPHVPDRSRDSALLLTTVMRPYRPGSTAMIPCNYSNEIISLNNTWKNVNLDDKEAWDHIREERGKYLRANARVAQACAAWYAKQKSTRSKEIIQVRSERMSFVLSKPKPLNDRRWKTLEPHIISIMDQIREKRLTDEHKVVLEVRMKPLESIICALRRKHGDGDFPTPVDFMNLPRVRRIVDAPTEVSLTAEDFMNAIEPILPDILNEWKTSVNQQLIKLISLKVELPESIDPLTLAVGQFFYCNRCWSKWSDTYKSVLHSVFNHLEIIDFDRIVSLADIVQKIIIANGQVPGWITAAELDNADFHFGCTSCEERFPGARCIMDWRTMVIHMHVKHISRDYGCIRVAAAEETKIMSAESLVTHT
ncbi:hypothetical protein ABKN59_003465 [Abortiporus biennis]